MLLFPKADTLRICRAEKTRQRGETWKPRTAEIDSALGLIDLSGEDWDEEEDEEEEDWDDDDWEVCRAQFIRSIIGF